MNICLYMFHALTVVWTAYYGAPRLASINAPYFLSISFTTYTHSSPGIHFYSWVDWTAWEARIKPTTCSIIYLRLTVGSTTANSFSVRGFSVGHDIVLAKSQLQAAFKTFLLGRLCFCQFRVLLEFCCRVWLVVFA